MSQEVEQAERALFRAAEKLGVPVRAGGLGAEARYGDAYQALVRLGARPQIRRKYRVGR